MNIIYTKKYLVYNSRNTDKARGKAKKIANLYIV